MPGPGVVAQEHPSVVEVGGLVGSKSLQNYTRIGQLGRFS